MAEREAEIVSVAGDRLRLRLVGSACSGCGGCGGRCNLFAADAAGELDMPAPPGPSARAGDRVRLAIDDVALRRLAWRGYGGALAGLLLGALAGQAVALAWGRHGDLLTGAGLVVGTLLAVRLTKRASPEPRLLGLAGPADPTACQGGHAR